MLVGRESEMSRLRALLDDARGGRGAAVVLHGEAGVGKSTLLRELQPEAEAHDLRVLRTSGIEAESPLAFGALHRLLLPLLDRLDRLPSPQARAIAAVFGLADSRDGDDDRFLVFLAALGLVSDAAEESPVLCVIDDAQWLDDASQSALLFMARRIDLAPVGIVFAARDGDLRRFEPTDLERITVAPLDADAADALLASAELGRTVAPDVRSRLVDRIGGNPLALVEIARALTAGQVSGASPLPADLPLTADLERVFADRVKRLDPSGAMTALLAALDDSDTIGVVLRAAERLGFDGAVGLADAARVGLLRADGSGLEFRHPLLRSAVVGSASTADRRRAHAALADGLEATDPDRAIWHRAAAADPPDEPTAVALEGAAARARRIGGHEVASSAFERAAELSPDHAAAATRLVRAAGSAWEAGDPGRTRVLAERVIRSADDPATVAEAERVLAFVEMNFGSPRLAHRTLVDAAGEALAAGDLATAKRFAMVASALATFGGDSGGSPDIGALVPSARSTERADACLSALLVGFDHLAHDRFADAAIELRRGFAVAESLQVPDLVTNIGIATLQLGDDEAALRWHDRQLDDARRSAAVLQVIHALTRRGVAQLTTGAWGELNLAVTEVLDLARATGQPNQRPLPLAQWLVVQAFRGARDVRDRAEAIEGEVRQHPAGVVDVLTLDLVAWARGVEAARVAPETALAHFGGIRLGLIERAASLDVFDAAARAGRDDLVDATVTRVERFASGTGSAWAAGDSAYGSALRADGDERERRLVEAVCRLEAGTRPLDLARAQLALGEHLRRARRRVDAREHLRAAIAGFERLGATAWADRAAEELRASGETARRRSAEEDAGALTAQELQVARLVKQGLSNREVAARLFVSPRTVEFHLRNVFAKLGITSRGGLAAIELEAPTA